MTDEKSAEAIVGSGNELSLNGGGLIRQITERAERQVVPNSTRRFKFRVCQPYLKYGQRYYW
jgi:hypothetical protein